jgi:O-succinylbenzoic acid--CoA ligase
MSETLVLRTGGEPSALVSALEQVWLEDRTVAIAAPEEAGLLSEALPAESNPAWGAAVVLGTGGTRGGRRWCLQPLDHLQVAVDGTAQWLHGLGFDPWRLELFNPLPLHHVSGLMLLLRARAWGADLRLLSPELMRSPEQLLMQASPRVPELAAVSLVPTQLYRLLDSTTGIRWLERFALIWVGGAALPAALAQQARQLGLRLAPCYGSTETGAMVAALSPTRFLAGAEGCGQPLPHAQLRLEPVSGAVQINTESLALGFFNTGELEPLPRQQGWWSSGDRALVSADGWQILGRLDGAIQSGAETVFPDQVEQRLLELAQMQGLPLSELLLLPEPDSLWGDRLVALVKPDASVGPEGVVQALQNLVRVLPPSQRPHRWLHCPGLQRTPLGKWERQRWHLWLLQQPVTKH